MCNSTMTEINFNNVEIYKYLFIAVQGNHLSLAWECLEAFQSCETQL
jgi:hypothetical protein